MSGRMRIGLLLKLSLLLVGLLSVFYVELPTVGATAKEPEPINREQQLQRFETVAESLYNHMQQGNAPEALVDMDLLVRTLEGLSFKGLTSIEGIHTLAESIMDTRETLAKVDVSQEEWLQVSARLRLAVNSLNHREDAIWLKYYKVMSEHLQQIETARVQGNYEEITTAFQDFKQRYEVIRSAAIISREPAVIAKFESWLSYAERLSKDEGKDQKALKQSIELGKGLLNELFDRKGDKPAFLPVTGYSNPWYWSTLIGVWIVLTLCYSAFRKYRGDQMLTTVGGKEDSSTHFRL